MDQELKTKIENQQELLEKIYVSTEKTRKYFLWTIIITIAVVILPFIGFALAIPKILNTYTSALGI